MAEEDIRIISLVPLALLLVKPVCLKGPLQLLTTANHRVFISNHHKTYARMKYPNWLKIDDTHDICSSQS